MQIVEKKLTELTPYENNPRMNEDAVDGVAESIKNYGFKVPLVIDRDGVIVCGHTRYKAAEKLGLTTVPCVVADDLNEKQIKAFRIADNKTSDLSIWDNKKLLEELDGLEDLFTGFTESDLFEDTLDNVDLDALEENEKGVVYEIKIKTNSKEKADKIMADWETIDL